MHAVAVCAYGQAPLPDPHTPDATWIFLQAAHAAATAVCCSALLMKGEGERRGGLVEENFRTRVGTNRIVHMYPPAQFRYYNRIIRIVTV